ncbi:MULTISPECIES: hypothetical protein [Nostocales]|uniref:Uncharacterized protein n=2 Tax=Nostocales TaxID=1161 RepID=A0ABW8WKC8_9CYAN|nr:hypothetical protein [Tolypothrix bouteillei]
MTLQELQEQALQLPISERWYLVQSVSGNINPMSQQKKAVIL